MKKLICAFLLLSLMLSGCGEKPQETTPTGGETRETTTAPETTEAAEPETTAASEPAVYRHPLTGEPQEEPFLGRPVTMSINNISDAMPQLGISGTDILYEVETEGGITRCLGLFTDYEDLPKMGAIRSARTYFVNLSLAYDAVFAHCGGSSYAMTPSYDSSLTPFEGWEHLDAMNHSGFYRDRDRLNSGYAYEHTLVTDGENLQKMLDESGYQLTYEETPDYGLKFDENAPVQGEPAQTVKIQFQGTKTTKMTYNETTGLYEAHQYGNNWIDGTTGDTLAFRNLLVLQTEQWKPDNYHSMYRLEGEGTGYMAMGGKIMPIKWSRNNVYEPFTYTFEDGTPVTLSVGKTYIAVYSEKGSVTCS